MTYVCTACGESKPSGGFYYNGEQRRPRCRACTLAAQRAKYQSSPERRKRIVERNRVWREANPDRYRNAARLTQAQVRDKRRASQFRLTPERHAEMLESQGGACAVCGRVPAKRLEIDHDHQCCPGKNSCGDCIRGLLCGSCNRAIGWLGDTPDSLMRAVRYLEGALPQQANVIELRKVSNDE